MIPNIPTLNTAPLHIQQQTIPPPQILLSSTDNRGQRSDRHNNNVSMSEDGPSTIAR